MSQDNERQTDQPQVPQWLAATVLVLLLAVVGAAGFIIRGQFDEGAAAQSTREIERKEEAVERDPEDVEGLLALGASYHQAGRLREAIEKFERVLEIRPFDTAALYGKGLVFIDQGNDREAEETLWDVLERDPGHVLAAETLGQFYAERGEYRSLVYTVRPVVEKNESSADLQYLMGYAYENLGRGDWAAARYRLALKYFPGMPEAQAGLERLGVVE